MTQLEEHAIRCDVLVAGGGPAGVASAIAAARNGAAVVLCQDRSVLGGSASSEVRMHIQGANCFGKFARGTPLETEPREGGIIEEIRLEAAVHNPQRSASMFDLILYDRCRVEPNLTLMLNTTVIAAETSSGRIVAVTADRPSTEDRFRIAADVFVDCTGDGRLGAEAGAPFMVGRESRAEFEESHAPPAADAHRLGSTVLLQARKHDRPMPFQSPPWARQFTADDLKLRLYATPGEEEVTHEYGYWWAEWGGTLDTIKDNEAIRDELLAVALGIWDHVKNGPPGTPPNEDRFHAAEWALEFIGFLPGKRESRRFVGQHVLTQDDIVDSREFADAIAFGGWMIDLHPIEGVDAVDEPPCVQHAVPYLYDIPLRSCVSQSIPNLMFAGRNISATHVAFASTRVMATCAAVGQGVGVAAARAVADQIPPSDLASRPEAMSAIRQRLLRDDAFLIGAVHADPRDAARAASVTASSEVPGGEAINVVSGQTRCVHGARGAPPPRARAGTHRWMSDPACGLPAWIRFDLASPQSVTEIQLVFDTGLHRHLTLSHHDGFTRHMLWGQPQPETVRDYEVDGLDADGEWHVLAEVSGNYQRLRRHRLETSPDLAFAAIRVRVLHTNGLDHARICEVRITGGSDGAAT